MEKDTLVLRSTPNYIGKTQPSHQGHVFIDGKRYTAAAWIGNKIRARSFALSFSKADSEGKLEKCGGGKGKIDPNMMLTGEATIDGYKISFKGTITEIQLTAQVLVIERPEGGITLKFDPLIERQYRQAAEGYGVTIEALMEAVLNRYAKEKL